MSLHKWLERHNACGAAREWIAAQPDQSPAALVAACSRGDWMVWVASRCGCDALARAADAAWRAVWAAKIAEYARCADDVRAALPDLAERWAAAIAEEVCQ